MKFHILVITIFFAFTMGLVSLSPKVDAVTVLPNDPKWPEQSWSLSMLNLPDTWALHQGNPIKVGLMDTGNPCFHIDLIGKCESGFVPVWAEQESEWDESFQGHAVSSGSIIAALTNNNEGVAAVARNVTLVPIKVCTRFGRCADNEGEDVDNVVAGINWAIARGDIKVINASIASTPYFQQIQDAVCAARDAGITVIAAAGNNGLVTIIDPDGTRHPAPPSFPLASMNCMLVVGGDSEASTRAPWVDVIARDWNVPAAACATSYTRPLGVHCNETYAGSWLEPYGYVGPVYGAPSGTSFAAPQVAGVVAIIRSLPRAWCNCAEDVAFIENAIKTTAQPFDCYSYYREESGLYTAIPSDGCGMGWANAYGALGWAMASIPTPTPSPTQTSTPSPTATVTSTPTMTPSPTPTPSATPTSTPTTTPSPTVTATPSPTVTPSPTPTPCVRKCKGGRK